MVKSVMSFVKTCEACQRRNQPPFRPIGYLQEIPATTKPFERFGLDTLGPFPNSTQDNTKIFVATDYFTKYVVAKAVPNGTAMEAAKFIVENIYCVFGAPKEILTDQVLEFRANFTEEVLNLLEIKHQVSPEARRLAQQQSQIANLKKKFRYDEGRRDAEFQPGDLVYVRIPRRYVGLSDKLLSHY